MQFNRNHYFATGIVVLLLGIQIHLVKTYVLTDQATIFIARNIEKVSLEDESRQPDRFLAAAGPESIEKKRITPPGWLGWALISVGSVLILHSWALPKAP